MRATQTTSLCKSLCCRLTVPAKMQKGFPKGASRDIPAALS